MSALRRRRCRTLASLNPSSGNRSIISSSVVHALMCNSSFRGIDLPKSKSPAAAAWAARDASFSGCSSGGIPNLQSQNSILEVCLRLQPSNEGELPRVTAVIWPRFTLVNLPCLGGLHPAGWTPCQSERFGFGICRQSLRVVPIVCSHVAPHQTLQDEQAQERV